MGSKTLTRADLAEAVVEKSVCREMNHRIWSN